MADDSPLKGDSPLKEKNEVPPVPDVAYGCCAPDSHIIIWSPTYKPPKSLLGFYSLTEAKQQVFVSNYMRGKKWEFVIIPPTPKILKSLVIAHQKYPCPWSALSLWYTFTNQQIQLTGPPVPIITPEQDDLVVKKSAAVVMKVAHAHAETKILRDVVMAYQKKPSKSLLIQLYCYFTRATPDQITFPKDELEAYVQQRIQSMLNDPSQNPNLLKDIGELFN